MKCSFYKLLYPHSLEEAKEGSYMIAIFTPREKVLDGHGEKLTSIKVVGHYLPTMEGMKVDMQGHWRKDPRYGLQFEMESYEEVIAPGKNGIVAYLSSGLIEGIGKKLAAQIYDKFGEDTLNILDREPDRISEVPGIGQKRSELIRNSYMETRCARKIITLLAPLDVSATQAVHLQKQLGYEAEFLLRNKPYSVYERGLIEFSLAEKLAARSGIPKTDPDRIAAALLYTLERQEQNGHLCQHKEFFIRDAIHVLDTPELRRMEVAQLAFSMLKAGRLILYHDHVYRPVYAQAEQDVAQRIREMLTMNRLPYVADLDDEIDKEQAALGITLAPEQRQAVKTALSYPLCIISGGPGTGKTMLQRIILNIYARWFPDNQIICCAPTGRAARRMEFSTGFPATTAHKALNLTGGDLRSLEMPEPLDADLLLCDEVSMMDMLLTWNLFHALPLNCRLILVGDVDQLPSVGPGAVLRELIASRALPVIKLDKVFRQSEGSLVAENARRIRLGDTNLELNNRDFQFIPAPDFDRAADLLVMRYLEEVRKYGVDNVALLTPYREKTATGARTINKRLRDIVNPASPDKPELVIGQRLFRLGDKVMQNKNTEEVSNGDIGYITGIESMDDSFTVEVDFGDSRLVLYQTVEALGHLELAYATTIHKSQGGEHMSVLISIQGGRMLQRSLIYTAITRAKLAATIVGSWSAVAYAIENNNEQERCTHLAARLNELQDCA